MKYVTASAWACAFCEQCFHSTPSSPTPPFQQARLKCFCYLDLKCMRWFGIAPPPTQQTSVWKARPRGLDFAYKCWFSDIRCYDICLNFNHGWAERPVIYYKTKNPTSPSAGWESRGAEANFLKAAGDFLACLPEAAEEGRSRDDSRRCTVLLDHVSLQSILLV